MTIEFVNLLTAPLEVLIESSRDTERRGRHSLYPEAVFAVQPFEDGRVFGHPRYPNGIPFHHGLDDAWVLKEHHRRFSMRGLQPREGHGERAIRNAIRNSRKGNSGKGGVLLGLAIQFGPNRGAATKPRNAWE